MNKTVVSHRIHPFRSDVILMGDVYRSLNPWSCALVGIINTSKSCLAFPNIAVGLSTASCVRGAVWTKGSAQGVEA